MSTVDAPLRLHVLTAVTRPANLEQIYQSIYSRHHPGWEIHWHLLHLDADAVGGQTVKNRLLDDVPGGFVYMLDDDTLLHPDFLSRTNAVIGENPDVDAIFFARIERGNIFQPEAKVGSIDIGQTLLRRDLIDELRIPDLYDGDGWFLQTIVGNARNAIYLSEPLCFYNLLR